jgi:acyl-CoA thioester hydrolase
MPNPSKLSNSSTESESSIEKLAYNAVNENWFEYPITVYPHHTDYGGVVWHGAYVSWMEQARIECMKSIGIDFASLVEMGCDLPVVEMSLRYHRALQMGETAVVKCKVQNLDGVRIKWDYEIQSVDQAITYTTATVALVAVDVEKGKIMRQLPANVKDAIVRLAND